MTSFNYIQLFWRRLPHILNKKVHRFWYRMKTALAALLRGKKSGLRSADADVATWKRRQWRNKEGTRKKLHWPPVVLPVLPVVLCFTILATQKYSHFFDRCTVSNTRTMKKGTQEVSNNSPNIPYGHTLYKKDDLFLVVSWFSLIIGLRNSYRT